MNLLIGSGTLAAVMVAGLLLWFVLIAVLIAFAGRRRRFLWNYGGKDIVAEVRMGRARLLIDGVPEDEFAGNVRICTLRSLVSGVEVRVRICYGFHVRAEAFANGTPLILMGSGK